MIDAMPLPRPSNSYYTASRSPRYSLLFALPLLLAYEVLAAGINASGSGIRNGADVILRGLFASIAGAQGPFVFGLLIAVGLLTFAIYDKRKHPGPLSGRYFLVMLAESAVLAVVFGLVVGLLTANILAALSLNIGGMQQLDFATTFTVSLGAGLYEELLFRVLLVGVLLAVARHLFGWSRGAAGTFAVVLGAVIFSAFHYIGPFGDALQLDSFLFRTIAGLAFSAMYVTRGFGITAWTHALYDVFLLLRTGL